MTWKKLRLGIGFVGLVVFSAGAIAGVTALLIYMAISVPLKIWLVIGIFGACLFVCRCMGEFLEHKYPERFAESDTCAGLPDVDPPKR